MPMHHTLSVLVENQPGVLARVAGLFSRRGFNIESLAVGPTEHEEQSRITIRVDCSQHSIDQVTKQLYKLINVLKVNELTAGEAIERELLIVRVSAQPTQRADLIRLAEVFNARVADVGPTSLMFECLEHPDKLHAFEEILRPYGIKELVRTGRVAMRKSTPERARQRRMKVLA
jgi:acetolactate synthase-1/3 small subunit